MDLGNRMRNIRIQKRKALREIAKRTELTTSFLSQVERNLTSFVLKNRAHISLVPTFSGGTNKGVVNG